MRVRRARADDGPGVHFAHASAIRGSCRTHYRAEEIEAWASRTTPEMYVAGVPRRDVFVAEDAGRVVGFAEFRTETQEVRAVYVHPDVGRRGVGRHLLRVLEDTARLRGRREVWLDSSLNAVPFYLAAGWRVERDTTHTLTPAVDIACVFMTKTLPPLRLAIRDEAPADRAAVRDLVSDAFERDDEAALVDRLRAAGALALSLVAVLDETVIGHIAFSPVEIDGAERVLGLGPMAVRPEYQRAAIGSRLVEEGLARLLERGWAGVVVLGHPAFYPRFGFEPASRHGLCYSAPVPDEAFMAAELVQGSLARASGSVRYRPEFAGV